MFTPMPAIDHVCLAYDDSYKTPGYFDDLIDRAEEDRS